jgi:hypothetical protein
VGPTKRGSDDLNQALLPPPSLHGWLPEEHLAHFSLTLIMSH